MGIIEFIFEKILRIKPKTYSASFVEEDLQKSRDFLNKMTAVQTENQKLRTEAERQRMIEWLCN